MIDQFARETHGVTGALLLAADGLVIATSDGFPRDEADKTAACASTLMSTANALGTEFAAGELDMMQFRTPNLHFLFMGVADRAALAVLANKNCSLSVVGNEMRRLVTAVGQRLNPDPRPAPGMQPVAPHSH
ncbi:roadblock/LC7 domain-containing protein [Plantactinospora sp. CA-290183]|uniref:roadblock/LC7 domain-containing protein n=1 Tax=Plantactinospora sp. CA-290183 TaxID=3240006 RepID=UPI003D8DDD4D